MKTELTLLIPVDLDAKLAECERKAWAALSGYKFYMFGYWAAAWVQCNSLLPEPRPNPFKRAVLLAREVRLNG